MTEQLHVVDVDSYPYVGLSNKYIQPHVFCDLPDYVEGIQRFFNESGLANYTGTSPSDVRAC